MSEEKRDSKKATRLGVAFSHQVVPLAGIELATFSLRMNCSTD